MRNSNIPERLGLYLETSGLSQKELSKLSGVPDSVICRVIKGQSTLSEKNLIGTDYIPDIPDNCPEISVFLCDNRRVGCNAR